MKFSCWFFFVSVPSSFLFAMHINQFIVKQPADNDPAFLAKKVVDLSIYKTMSKWQPAVYIRAMKIHHP